MDSSLLWVIPAIFPVKRYAITANSRPINRFKMPNAHNRNTLAFLVFVPWFRQQLSKGDDPAPWQKHLAGAVLPVQLAEEFPAPATGGNDSLLPMDCHQLDNPAFSRGDHGSGGAVLRAKSHGTRHIDVYPAVDGSFVGEEDGCHRGSFPLAAEDVG